MSPVRALCAFALALAPSVVACSGAESPPKVAPTVRWVEGPEDATKLRGQVVDATTGAPVAGAVVSATSLAIRTQPEAVTDARGVFLFPALGPGDYELQAIAESHRPLGRKVTVAANAAPPRVDFALEPDASRLKRFTRSDSPHEGGRGGVRARGALPAAAGRKKPRSRPEELPRALSARPPGTSRERAPYLLRASAIRPTRERAPASLEA